MKKYIVREHDTMWSISKATGVRLNLLMAANPHISDPNQIKPGSILVVPELHKGNVHGSLEQSVPKPAPTAKSGTQSMPKPAPAAKLGTHSMPKSVPVQAPMPTPTNMSPMPSTHPGSPFFGFVWPHVVKTGETWASISKHYKVNITHLKQMNPIHADAVLQEGDILYIPGAAGKGTASQAPAMQSPGTQQVPGGQPMMQGTPPAGPSVPEYGPHTHHPYRVAEGYGYQESQAYDERAQGYRVPQIPPGMWAFVPIQSKGHGTHLPMYPPSQLSPYRAVPSTWYSEWESSSWDSDWSSSTIQPRSMESDSLPGGVEPKWFGESRDGTSQD